LASDHNHTKVNMILVTCQVATLTSKKAASGKYRRTALWRLWIEMSFDHAINFS